MKTFPLQSLTIIEAQQKQFALVDSICRHFPGSEFLTGGDLGLTPGLNQPRVTQRVEQVLADAFHAQAAALVQGAGTGAIRAGLAALLKPGQRLLVHDAPVYPTTRVIIEQMGLTLITVDFNDLSALKQVVDRATTGCGAGAAYAPAAAGQLRAGRCAGNVARGRCSSVNR